MSNPSQLFLLADHIKLSLLEVQRAQTLNLPPSTTQYSSIARSLESLRAGIDSLANNQDPPTDADTLSQLRTQYNDLSRQSQGEGGSTTIATTLSTPNDPALKDDFAHARSSSDQKRTPTRHATQRTDSSRGGPKNVRFRDDPSANDDDEDDEANRAALFPSSRYTDDEAPRDPTTQMDNQQVHAYHSQVLRDQDDQLDRLGESIGRQRYLGMQIGDELEGQIGLLDEVDRGVDRTSGRLDGAKRRLRGVGETAKRNWGMTTIVVLVVILVLLIAVLK